MIANLDDQHRISEAVCYDTACQVLADLAETMTDPAQLYRAVQRYPLDPEHQRRVLEILLDGYYSQAPGEIERAS